jgi:hypothetical protein
VGREKRREKEFEDVTACPTGLVAGIIFNNKLMGEKLPADYRKLGYFCSRAG